MIIFFLSYLSIDLTSVWKILKGYGGQIVIFTAMKLALLPVIIFLSFISSRRIMPFRPAFDRGFRGCCSANGLQHGTGKQPMVLVVVVITSTLAPFTLPALIKMIASKEMVISFLSMLQMLVTVIFIPIIFVEIIRYLLPRLITPILKIRFPVSLLLFALINLGVFSAMHLFSKKNLL